MMCKVVCLIIILFIMNTFIMLCVGNVMEIFNHPEEQPLEKHTELREDIDKPSYYPNDDQIIDDLYTSLDADDYKNGLYAINRPDFKTRLFDALSRIKYVDGSMKSRRQTNEDQYKTYEHYKQKPFGDVDNYVPDDNYNSKEKLLKRNTVDSVTFAPRNSFENLLYDEFYKSPNNNPLLAKLPQSDPEMQQNSVAVRPRYDQRNNIQSSISGIINNEIDINNSISLISSLLKNKKDEKFKDHHLLKGGLELDTKFKRDLPDMDGSNDTDSADLNKIEENIIGLNDRNVKLGNSINENSIAMNENKRYSHVMTELDDANTEFFVDNIKENSETNEEKENGCNNDGTGSDDSLHELDERTLDRDSAAEEFTEEKEFVDKEPQENTNKIRFKMKHKDVDRSFISKENEKFRICRREEGAKITGNNITITDNLANANIDKHNISIEIVTHRNGINNPRTSNSINTTDNYTSQSSNPNNVQQPQMEKTVMLINNPVNRVVQEPLLLATPVTVHNVTDNTTAPDTAVILSASRSGKGRLVEMATTPATKVAYESRFSVEAVTNAVTVRNSTSDKCSSNNVTKSNMTDELKIAKQINDYVRNLLIHASKTSMRKELGLCKTYDKAYTSVKSNNNGVEDEIMKGMMCCLSKIISGSIKPTPCGEMPVELLQFLDWLLLNGVSARDEFKQYMINGGSQRKTFLFAKNDNVSADKYEDSIKPSPMRNPNNVMKTGRNESANGTTSLYSNLKRTLLSGLSPYLKYGNGNDNLDLSRQYPFSNNHVISNRNVKFPSPNGYNRYKYFSPLIDQDLYRMYPYYHPPKERWAKASKYADQLLNENPYEDMYLPRSKLNYPHLFNVYPKLSHDQSGGVVGDEELAQFDNPLARKQAADFDRIG